MADQVTISTFLELRDHLSGGVNRVVDELQRLNRTVDAVNSKMKAAETTHRNFERAAVSGAGNARTALEGLRGVANTLASPILAAVSAIGGFAALKSAIKLGQEFEDVSIRIAGTIKAFDLAPTFGIATKQASSVIGTIQDLAAALPGEVDDYITVFAQALPKSIAAGMTDVRKVADFTSRYTAVAISNTVDAQQAGMDLFRMLAGQAGADVRMWTVLAEKIGMDAKEFNKLAASVRQSKIDVAIKAFDDQLEAAGNTFSAKFGEMQSRLKEIVRLGSAQLFVGVKDVLTEINKYLLENKAQLVSTITVIARDFLDLIRRLPTLMREVGQNLSDIWDYSKLIVGIWAGAQLLNGLAGALALYKQIKDVVIAINAAGAVGAATGVAGAATQTAATGAASRLGILGALGIATAGIATFLYPKSAGESELEWEAKRRKEIDALIEMQTKYGQIIAAISEKLAGIPAAVADPGVAMKELYREFSQQLKAPLSLMARSEVATKREQLVEYAQLQGIDVNELLEGTLTPPRPPKETPKAPTINFNNNRFDIKQEFAEGYDPDRIAVAFANDLSRIGDMKIAAAYVQTGAGR